MAAVRGLWKRHNTLEVEDIRNVTVLKRQLINGNHVLEASINHKFKKKIQQRCWPTVLQGAAPALRPEPVPAERVALPDRGNPL